MIDPCGPVERGIDIMLYRETFRSPIYYDVYIDGLYLLLLYVGPLTTLLYMNVRLVEAIRKSRRRHNMRVSRMSSGRTTWSPSIDALQSPTATSVSNNDKNATVVLMIIVVVFVVCETPELIHKLVTFTERNFPYGLEYSRHLVRLNIASELLMVVNSSANFVVYVAFGRRFRRILRETFRFSFRFSGSGTALTHDLPAAAGAHGQGGGGLAQYGCAPGDRGGAGTGAVRLAQQRLQYHHNCVHVHKVRRGIGTVGEGADAGQAALHCRRGGH
jgi:hypothetical protein